jgi:hypothetical protein
MNRLLTGEPTSMTFGLDGIAITMDHLMKWQELGEQMRKFVPRCLLQSRRVRADVGAGCPR